MLLTYAKNNKNSRTKNNNFRGLSAAAQNGISIYKPDYPKNAHQNTVNPENSEDRKHGSGKRNAPARARKNRPYRSPRAGALQTFSYFCSEQRPTHETQDQRRHARMRQKQGRLGAPDGPAAARPLRSRARLGFDRRENRRRQYLRIHRRREAGVDRHDPFLRRGQEPGRNRAPVRDGMPVGTLQGRAAAGDSGSGRLLRRAGYGRRSRRGRRTMARTSRGRADADDSPALRLSENLGRLRPPGAATARSR